MPSPNTFWQHVRNKQWYQVIGKAKTLSADSPRVAHVLYKQCYWGPNYSFGQIWARPTIEWTPDRFKEGEPPKSVEMFAYMYNQKQKYAFVYEPKTIIVYGTANMAGSAEEHTIFEMDKQMYIHPSQYFKMYLDGLHLAKKKNVSDMEIFFTKNV